MRKKAVLIIDLSIVEYSKFIVEKSHGAFLLHLPY